MNPIHFAYGFDLHALQGWALGWSCVGYLWSTVVDGFTFSGTHY